MVSDKAMHTNTFEGTGEQARTYSQARSGNFARTGDRARTSNLTRTDERDIAHVISRVMEAFDTQSYDATRKIMQTWFEINGDRERRHTKGVFLLEKGNTTTLIVYVDSPSIVQDFLMNKHLYLGRFSMTDYCIHDIQFRLSRYVDTQSNAMYGDDGATSAACSSTKAAARELSQDEKQSIYEACSILPESLREVAYNALISIKSAGLNLDTHNS